MITRSVSAEASIANSLTAEADGRQVMAQPGTGYATIAPVHSRVGRNVSLAVLCALLLLAVPAAAASQPRTFSASVGDSPYGQTMAAGFVGVSFEYKALHLYTGRDPRAVDPVLVQLLRGLAPGHSPVVRIGGDSSDYTWWPIRGVIPPGGITYSLTDGWLRTTRALARALRARMIMGINLASGRPALAATEARAILQGIGRRYADWLEIGNEPDLYGQFVWYRDRRGRLVSARQRGYNFDDYLRDFSRWRAALPAAPLAGPAFAGLSWMGGLDRFISTEGPALVTFHRYPLRGCVSDPASPSYASIRNLMSDQSSAGLAQQVAPFVPVAHGRSVPFRLDEMNSAACRGRRGVSDTFASALWVLDTLFNMAAVGVDGVNVHTLPGAAYELFTVHPRARWHAFVHPEYYGMMVFAQAFPFGARLLPVSAPSGAVKVWATQAPDQRTRVVLINKNRATAVHVVLQLSGSQTPAALQALRARGLSAKSGVSFDGQTFGSRTDTGTLTGSHRTGVVQPLAGAYSFDLPAASAMLLTR